MPNRSIRSLVLLLLTLVLPRTLAAQPGSFGYQGRLVDGGVAANGSYDFQFALYPTSVSGVSVGSQTILGVAVTNGIFSVRIDLGSFQFPGDDRFLEVRVKPAGSANPYVVLSPRQPVLSAPYAIRAGRADPTDGSAYYIHNGTSTQASANFNISGSGTVGGTLNAASVDVSTAYNKDGIRILSGTDSRATAVGFQAGVGGTDNTHLGYHAGGSAFLNDTNDNTFLGSDAGGAISFGDENTFVGSDSGDSNTLGSSNTFVGRSAGTTNTTGSNNTVLGAGAQLQSAGLNFASAIGSGAVATASNTVTLGRASDTVRIPGNLIVTGTISNIAASSPTDAPLGTPKQQGRLAGLEEKLQRQEIAIAALRALVTSQQAALDALLRRLEQQGQ